MLGSSDQTVERRDQNSGGMVGDDWRRSEVNPLEEWFTEVIVAPEDPMDDPPGARHRAGLRLPTSAYVDKSLGKKDLS